MEWLKRKEKEQPIEREEIYDVEVKESIETLKRQQEEMKTTISDLVRRIRTLEQATFPASVHCHMFYTSTV